MTFWNVTDYGPIIKPLISLNSTEVLREVNLTFMDILFLLGWLFLPNTTGIVALESLTLTVIVQLDKFDSSVSEFN
jgi:hypothetical protein